VRAEGAWATSLVGVMTRTSRFLSHSVRNWSTASRARSRRINTPRRRFRWGRSSRNHRLRNGDTAGRRQTASWRRGWPCPTPRREAWRRCSSQTGRGCPPQGRRTTPRGGHDGHKDLGGGRLAEGGVEMNGRDPVAPPNADRSSGPGSSGRGRSSGHLGGDAATRTRGRSPTSRETWRGPGRYILRWRGSSETGPTRGASTVGWGPRWERCRGSYRGGTWR